MSFAGSPPACIEQALRLTRVNQPVDCILPVGSRCTRLCRVVLEVAGKILRHAHKTTLNVTRAAWDMLQIDRVWERANEPPAFA